MWDLIVSVPDDCLSFYFLLAPTWFRMMFPAMLTGAFQDCDYGVSIRYRFGGKLFNLRRLQAKSNLHQTEVVDELLYADNMAKKASTEKIMQEAIDRVSQACDNHDLKISTKND